MSDSRSIVQSLMEELIERACGEGREYQETTSSDTEVSSLSPASSSEVTGVGLSQMEGPLDDPVLAAIISSTSENSSPAGYYTPIAHHQGMGNGWLRPRRLFNNDTPEEYGGHTVQLDK